MKPTHEEYLLAKEVIKSYEQEEIYEDVPHIIGYLNRRIGFNGYKICLPGHPVFEYKDMYYIEIEPLEGSNILPMKMKYYKHSLNSSIDKNQ